MRFDPYTGEPINDDAPNTDSTKDTVTNQEEAATSEPGTDTTSNVDSDGYGVVNSTEPVQPQNNTYTSQGQYDTNNQGQYNTQGQTYNPYGNANPQGQQYNPYNGQAVNRPVDQDAKAGKLGTAGLVCGIISIVFSFASACCCPIISLGTGIAAIICGANAKKSNGERDGKGTGGIVTGIIGLVLMVIITVCVFIFSSTLSSNSSSMDRFRDYFENGTNYDFGTDSNIETTPSVAFDDITVK